NAIKQEREAAKLKTAAEEFYRTNQNTNNSADGLSSLFVQKEKPKFSLNSINTGSTANSALRPTLRASLKGNVNGVITDTLPPKSAEADFVPMRRRGRSPKLKPI
ncbi:MAG: hypothetical protein LBB36_02090, partial [Fibromonadaceae bacterium]|nr:hypothetical protein [Fibromonadaceae bacterium]